MNDVESLNGRDPLKPLKSEDSFSRWMNLVFFPSQHVDSFPREMFRKHLKSVLELSNLRSHHIDYLVSYHNLDTYIQAFTHASVGVDCNYEWFEIMGDAILNKCMVYYINQRFPFLHNHEGVKVIARLKINLVSKKMFSEISARLQFPMFIRYQESVPKTNPKALFEDVLESFFGLTEWLLDKSCELGVGHVACYNILKSIMDTYPISLKYEDLYDNITRLKETFDVLKPHLWGQIKYENFREESGRQHVKIFQVCPQSHRKVLLYECYGVGLDETKQAGAQFVLQALKQQGLEKQVPPYYIQLQELLHQHHRTPSPQPRKK